MRTWATVMGLVLLAGTAARAGEPAPVTTPAAAATPEPAPTMGEPAAVPEATVAPAPPPLKKTPLFAQPLADKGNLGVEAIAGLSTALTSALRQGARYQVTSPADAGPLVPAERLRPLLGCDQPACQRELSKLVGAELLAAGEVAVLGADRVLSLTLVDGPKGIALARVTRTLPAAEAGLAVERAAAELLAKAEDLSAAELAIVSEPPGARVSVDGRDLGVTPLPLFFIRPGSHRLVLRLAKFKPAEKTLTLVDDDAQTETLTLEAGEAADPGEAAIAEEAPATVDAREAEAQVEAERARRELAAREAAEKKAADERAEVARQAALREQQARDDAAVQARKVAEEQRLAALAAAVPKRTLGLVLRLGYGLPSSEAAAALDDLEVGAGERIVLGATAKVPLWGRFHVALDVDYWHDRFFANDPPVGTASTSRAAPVGMVAFGAGVGLHYPLPNVFFADAGLGLGGRWTRFARHETFEGGEPLDQLSTTLSPTLGGNLGVGFAIGMWETSLALRLSIPLKSELPAAHVGAQASVGGFGGVAIVALQSGLSF